MPRRLPGQKGPTWKLVTINLDRGLLRRVDEMAVHIGTTRVGLVSRYLEVGLNVEGERQRLLVEVDRRVEDEVRRRLETGANGGKA